MSALGRIRLFFNICFICFYIINIEVHDFSGNYPIFCLKYWKTYFLLLTYLAISKVQWIFFFFGCKLQCFSKLKKHIAPSSETQLYTACHSKRYGGGGGYMIFPSQKDDQIRLCSPLGSWILSTISAYMFYVLKHVKSKKQTVKIKD